jgi:hypothetical protein
MLALMCSSKTDTNFLLGESVVRVFPSDRNNNNKILLFGKTKPALLYSSLSS